jgi:lipid-A-disaccharide synthase
MQLAMVAGEASGDLLASLLLGGIQARWPALRTAGIGGPKMAAQGFEAWWPSDKLAVRGYVEVLRHYRGIKAIRDALGDRLLRERPAGFVGVDAPDFNLGLEKRLKSAGVRTVHFVCPSIWPGAVAERRRWPRAATTCSASSPSSPSCWPRMA